MTTKVDEAQEECEHRVEEYLHARFDVGVGNIDSDQWNHKVAAKNAAFDAYTQAAVDAKDARITQLEAALEDIQDASTEPNHAPEISLGEINRRAAAAQKGGADADVR